MTRKHDDKGETLDDHKDVFKTWTDSYVGVSKMWDESYLKLYKPWIEFMDVSQKMTDLSMNTVPKKYKDFYDEWMKTYQNSFGKLYPVQTTPPKETLENFLKCADESKKLYKSWYDEFEENSRKTMNVLNNGADPAKYKECQDMWMNTYEKISEQLLDQPAIKYHKEIFENYTGIPDFYSEDFAKISKLWKDSYTKLYNPWAEAMQKLSENIAKISKGEADQETYKEFYNTWMNTYQETLNKLFDGQSMKPSKEALENFVESTNIYLNLYKSWTATLEKMSEKIKDQSKLAADPEAYKEFFNLWVKMHEKAFEDFYEGMPLASPMKEILEPAKNACKTYSNASIKMSKLWMDSYMRSARPFKV
ncbi:MAG TPA: hypothetical protein VIO58_10685 [Candidatus Methanoperedens sp.]